METHTIISGVIEPIHGYELVITVIRKTGIVGDLMAQFQEFIKQAIELLPVLQATADDLLVGRLTHATIRLPKEIGRLLERQGLAVELNAHGTGDLTVLLLTGGKFGIQGNVLFPE